jgi:hypothetical protein
VAPRTGARSCAWKHQSIGWLLFLGALAVVFYPVTWVIRAYSAALPGLHAEGTRVLIFAAVLLGALVALLYVAVRLFLWGWFAYLRGLPIQQRNVAEGRLALAMNLYAFEPLYSRVRQSHLGGEDA